MNGDKLSKRGDTILLPCNYRYYEKFSPAADDRKRSIKVQAGSCFKHYIDSRKQDSIGSYHVGGLHHQQCIQIQG